MIFDLKFHTNPGKLSVKDEGRIKTFSDKQDFQIFTSMHLYSQRFWGMCYSNQRSEPRKRGTKSLRIEETGDPTEQSVVPG